MILSIHHGYFPHVIICFTTKVLVRGTLVVVVVVVVVGWVAVGGAGGAVVVCAVVAPFSLVVVRTFAVTVGPAGSEGLDEV